MNKDELIKKLLEICVTPDFYSLDGELLADRIIRKKSYEGWNVFYFDERGGINDEHMFTSELEANNYIYDLFAKDAEMYSELFAKRHPTYFVQISSYIKYILEVNYSKGGIFLYTYQNEAQLNEEFIADTYEKAITAAYKKYGLNPYAWEKYEV